MKKFTISFIASALLFSGLFSCRPINGKSNGEISVNQDNAADRGLADAQKSVVAPFEGVNIPTQKYTVSADKASKLELPNGTTIEIPAGAFVKADGTPVTGDVTLDYREFHRTADLITSGIPMNDHEAGSYLETAGMFEIKGSQGSDAVKVAPGKPLLVNLASYADNSRVYDKWVLDTETGKWTNIGTCPAATPNAAKLTKLNSLDAEIGEKPLMPTALNNSKPVFDLDVNYAFFPELKSFHGVIWEYAGTESKDKIDWVFDETWSKINLTEGSEAGIYNLNLSTGEKNFTTPVRPVLKGNDLAVAQASFTERMDRYKVKLEEQKEMRETLAKQCDLRRSMAVSNFGIHNFDILNQWERMVTQVSIDFEGKDNLSQEIKGNIQYFLIMGKRKAAIRYWESQLKDFNYPRNESVCILAVLPGNKIATIGAEDFKKLNLSKGDKVAIELKVQSASITSADDLQKELDKLM